MASQSPAQPEAQQQNGDVPQWMKNYASYQSNGTPAPTTSNNYQTAAPAGDTSQGGGYQIIMVVMILACVAVFGFLYINKDKAPAMPPPAPGMPGSVTVLSLLQQARGLKLQPCASFYRATDKPSTTI
jgi:hypothetical protein